ncbi:MULTISPECIES: hypothetical protein [unclassified Roseitalea]|uniref:hypothetical protein n=1 Tax=unclassified Roseitalea TaxID=2639107 RepID=UPI00273D306E|nr:MULTISPECIES: hypothetical protein [unclassified Roseitalea]
MPSLTRMTATTPWPHALAALIAIGALLAPHAAAMSEPVPGRLTGDTLTAAFVGKTYRGVYQDGVSWRETYLVDGEVDYQDDVNAARGEWFVREDLLCTFYDGDLVGGCFVVMRRSENCFDFYAVDLETNVPAAGWGAVRGAFGWTARGGRSDLLRTCPEGLVS